MNYQPLLTLNLSHTYYVDGRCPDFDIVPDARTQAWLRNQRIVLRTRPGSLTALVVIQAKDTPLVPLPASFTLRFHLNLRSPEFPLITELPAFARVVYANTDTTTLSAREDPTPASAPFARAELTHRGGLAAAPTAYTIAFTAKALRWVYFLVTPASSAKFAIQADGVTFSAYNPKDNDLPISVDALSTALAGQFVDRKIVCLASKERLACQQGVRKAVGLSQNQTLIIRNLPNPKPSSLALLGKEPVLYEVVKLLPVAN